MSEPKQDPTREQIESNLPETVEEAEGAKVPKSVATALPNVPDTLPQVDLDTILMNEIGDFGKYQLQCLIPECESEPAKFDQPWVTNAVPPGHKGSLDYCQRYGRAAPGPRPPGACPAELFDRSKRLPCDKYVHENTNSVVYDFGLECQEWRRTLLGVVRKLGTLTSLPITSYMSDRFGRRIAIAFTSFNSAWIGLNRLWAFNYTSFAALEFIETTFGSGLFASCYILMVELFGPKYRVAAGAMMHTSFAVGQIVLGMIAWRVPHWRRMTLAVYLPQLSSILSYWLISESVRWYLSKGRFEDSEALLKKMARVNGRSVADSSLAALRRTVQEKLRSEEREGARRGELRELAAQVWRHKHVLLRVLVSPVWWVASTFIYHGLVVNAVNISGNKYFNFIAVAAVEIPGFWLAYILLNKLGRKPVLTGGFCVCAACQLVYVFMPQGWSTMALTVYLMAKCAISMVMTGVYVYTAELYPTRHRHKLLAVASICGRLGSILAPLTPAFAAQWYADLPFILFGGLALLAGALVFLTPETLGTVLPDTFEQAEQLGLKGRR
ncbi:hypothetical protein PYW07_003524 [Mythimna separata]|uniref:Major facilitator superfamily (MFS) profile domain-containing protein n=1 Tax=Mythimna separata TaxID=271217 RepID=A0AAD7YI30_MYTSE|nr:hypothetical protein PYW07_003524 [Mythimna separata]